jgi:hypothetical protein
MVINAYNCTIFTPNPALHNTTVLHPESHDIIDIYFIAKYINRYDNKRVPLGKYLSP